MITGVYDQFSVKHGVNSMPLNNWHHFVTGLTGLTLCHSTPHIVSWAEAILSGMGPQVHHLMKAEFAAID